MKYKTEQGNEEINSTGGVYLVGAVLNSAGMFADPDFESGGDLFKYKGHFKAMVGIICAGRTDFNDLDFYRKDVVFKESLGLPRVPSEATFRQRLNEAAMLGYQELIPGDNLELLRLVERFGTLAADGMKFTPIHCDVTPMDNSGTKKEGVGRTYKGMDGFAPIMAYVGTKGYLLNCELHPVKQHCQNGTPAFLSETMELEERLGVENPLYIMDSGNDSAENMDLFLDRDRCFIIKRNPRKEPLPWLVSHALSSGASFSPRRGKTIYTGSLSHARPRELQSEQAVFLHYEVTERTIDAKGEPLLIPSYEINSWWTNIPNYTSSVVDF